MMTWLLKHPSLVPAGLLVDVVLHVFVCPTKHAATSAALRPWLGASALPSIQAGALARARGSEGGGWRLCRLDPATCTRCS